MTVPLNRVVAFAGPYLSVIAGGIASWLVAMNLVGLPGLDEHSLQTTIAGGVTGLLVAGLTWRGQSKWLAGHDLQIKADARVNAAALAVAPPGPPAASAPVAYTNGAGNGFHADEIANVPDPYVVEDLTTAEITGDELVSDEDEFAAPPPPASYRPVGDPEPVT